MTKINQDPNINKHNIKNENVVKIDISTITEELRTLTYNEDYSGERVLEAYSEMFRKSSTLINKYIVKHNIGNYLIGQISDSEDDMIFLHPDGRLVTFDFHSCCTLDDDDDYDQWKTQKLEDVFDYLYPPNQILYNIFIALRRHIKSNKEKIEALKLASYRMKVL